MPRLVTAEAAKEVHTMPGADERPLIYDLRTYILLHMYLRLAG